ncbi:MAG: 30S ribosomal protein S20 [Simkaniaceae bacterium]|nr:30S ribosomal protein S20 [Simkaniaceae bacterium]
MAEKKVETKKKRPTAEKRMIQNEKKRMHNRSIKAKVLTHIRGVEKSAKEKDQTKVGAGICTLYSLIDKAVKTGVYNKHKAARMKSKMTLLGK